MKKNNYFYVNSKTNSSSNSSSYSSIRHPSTLLSHQIITNYTQLINQTNPSRYNNIVYLYISDTFLSNSQINELSSIVCFSFFSILNVIEKLFLFFPLFY